MLKIDDIIIVEGKYDKIKLKNFIDAKIIETNGFRIFKDKKKQQMIKEMSKNCNILILTDSDSAGFMIRNFLKSFIEPQKIKNAYIPQILGKEKRKNQTSKEGFLGVEGVSEEILAQCIAKHTSCDFNDSLPKITKQMLFIDGLSGGENSKNKREKLLNKLNLPEYLSVNAMIDVLNTIISLEQYKEIIREINEEC